MRLGILVTTDRSPEIVRGITLAALAKGHTVTIFATDEGTRLLGDAGIALHVLRLNAGGEPAHPLYLPARLAPVPWR